MAAKTPLDIARLRYFGHLVRKERETKTYEVLVRELKLSKPQLKDLEAETAGVGMKTIQAFADKYHGGKIDDLNTAALEFAKSQPEPVQRVVALDAVNAKEQVKQTPAFANATRTIQRAYEKRAPYTPNERFPDFDAYMQFLLTIKKHPELVADEPEGAVADDVEDPDEDTNSVLLFGAPNASSSTDRTYAVKHPRPVVINDSTAHGKQREAATLPNPRPKATRQRSPRRG